MRTIQYPGTSVGKPARDGELDPRLLGYTVFELHLVKATSG